MTYSFKERDGKTEIGADGTVITEVVVAVFFNNERLGSVTRTKMIKPGDDISGDTSRAAQLATIARKNDEREAAEVVRR